MKERERERIDRKEGSRREKKINFTLIGICITGKIVGRLTKECKLK